MTLLEQAVHAQEALPVSLPESEALLEQRWNMPVDQFLSSSMKRTKVRSSQKLTADADTDALLVALALFASFTQGQAKLAKEFLTKTLKAHDKDISTISYQDILVTITSVYEDADIVGHKAAKGKSGKAKDRERRKARKASEKRRRSSAVDETATESASPE